MNKKQYNNVIDWTLKHDQAAQTEDSLATARAVFNNMGVALPNGSMQEVYEIIKTNDYMGWRACTMEEAQQAANRGAAAIGISENKLVILSAVDKEEPVAESAFVMTLSEKTSAYSVAGLEYYTYIIKKSDRRKVTVAACSYSGMLSSSTRLGQQMASAFGSQGDYEVCQVENKNKFEDCWDQAGACVIVHTHADTQRLYDEFEDDQFSLITSIHDIQYMTRNNNISFVFMVACKAAGGNASNNVAYWLSQKINPNGIVIANTENVVDVTDHQGNYRGLAGNTLEKTWKVYKNGVVLDIDVPAILSVHDAYAIYRNASN